MKSQRKRQIMTLSILLVAVLVISVGFAAFSSTLRISSSATVNPDSSNFKVIFSSSSTALETNSIAANPSTLGESATIDNSTIPTISGLNAKFTSPGDSVSYTFYVRNEGEYQAYLNSINYLGYTSCTAGEGTTSSLVQAACDDIKTTVTVGSVTATDTMLNISGETLNKGESKAVTVTLTYNTNGDRADGPFTVNFGDISLYYASVTGENEVVDSVCKLNDADNDGIVDTGEEVTCTKDTTSESFYVVDSSNGNVNMLSKYNLTLSTTAPLQDSTDTSYPSTNGIAFSSSTYWYDSTNSIYTVDANYSSEGRSRAYIYNSSSNIYPYVEAYRDVLEGMGVNVIDAKLLSFEQAISLGCVGRGCVSAPSWVYSSAYWIGSLSTIEDMPYLSDQYNYLKIIVYYNSHPGLVEEKYNSNQIGIRPVITISASDLG